MISSVALSSVGLGSGGRSSSVGLYTVVGAVSGGTAEALGGGKFANGAVTGAFVGMFNEAMHQVQQNVRNTLQNIPSEKTGGYMGSKQEAHTFCFEKANSINKEVSYLTKIDSETGDKVYFVQPWHNNTRTKSINYTNKGEDGYRYHDGDRVIAQDHYAPYVPGQISSGGVAGYDYFFAVKIRGTVRHHDGGGKVIFEYTPTNYIGLRIEIEER